MTPSPIQGRVAPGPAGVGFGVSAATYIPRFGCLRLFVGEKYMVATGEGAVVHRCPGCSGSPRPQTPGVGGSGRVPECLPGVMETAESRPNKRPRGWLAA